MERNPLELAKLSEWATLILAACYFVFIVLDRARRMIWPPRIRLKFDFDALRQAEAEIISQAALQEKLALDESLGTPAELEERSQSSFILLGTISSVTVVVALGVRAVWLHFASAMLLPLASVSQNLTRCFKLI